VQITPRKTAHTHPGVVPLASLQLIEILRTLPFTSDSLIDLHIRLNISWDELRSIICPLRAIYCEDDMEGGLGALFFCASNLNLSPRSDFDSTISAIARGNLRVLKNVLSGEAPIYHW
jgi:hypothetical protein